MGLRSPLPSVVIRTRRKRWGAFYPTQEWAFPKGPSGWLIACLWKVGVGNTVHRYLTYLYFDESVINLNLIHVCDL